MTRRVLLVVAVVLAVAWVPPALGSYFTCTDQRVYPLTMIETALKKFYTQTKGPTNWPAIYRSNWDSANPCAWDGNERAHPAPFGTRCVVNGGLYKEPPDGLGGLYTFWHLSGAAEGPIPEEFKAFTATDVICLHGNKLSGPIWDTSNHCAIHRLDLSSNQLSGTLPSNFMQKNVKAMELLNLADNAFTGTLPPTITEMAFANSLLLRRNQFSGSLPDLSHLTALRHLDVSFNNLDGTLGAWIGDLSNLAWLVIEGNRFSGSLPSRFPPMLSRFVGGAGNRFSGAVPTSLGDLGMLQHFNCTGCDLTCPKEDLLAHLLFSSHCAKRPPRPTS